MNKDKAQGCTLDDVECTLKLKITSTDFLQEIFINDSIRPVI
jgi:hypothetical protein